LGGNAGTFSDLSSSSTFTDSGSCSGCSSLVGGLVEGTSLSCCIFSILSSFELRLSLIVLSCFKVSSCS